MIKQNKQKKKSSMCQLEVLRFYVHILVCFGLKMHLGIETEQCVSFVNQSTRP